MPENPRIALLRQRIENDPASIAFAQLAEEYRRAGSYAEAIETCRAGLGIHPGYLSARVTLGRALIEVNDLEAAEPELSYVLEHASENLAAIRGLAEIHHRRGNLNEALGFYRTALGLARHDPDLEQAIADISRSIAPSPALAEDGMSFEQATAEFLSFLDQYPAPSEPSAPVVDDLVAMFTADLEASPASMPAAGLKASPTPVPAADLEVSPASMLAADLKASPTPDVVSGFGPAMSYRPAMSYQEMRPVEQAATDEDMPEILQMPPVVLENPVLPGLERFLEAIHIYRQRRAV